MSVSTKPRSVRVVMLAALPTLTGIILLMGILNYDIRQTPSDTLDPRLFEED